MPKSGCSGSFDSVLDLCRDKKRRIVLAVLADQERTLTVRDLTQLILRHNHHIPLGEASGETVGRIQSELHHQHLPRVEAVGIIKYDRERQRVERTDQFDRMYPTISAIIEADPDIDPPLEW